MIGLEPTRTGSAMLEGLDSSFYKGEVMPVVRYRSVNDVPPPWHDPSDRGT